MSLSNYKIYATSQEAWQAMYESILMAEKSIYWEVYIFADDEIGRRFFHLLEEKAKQGLDVKIIVDSFGSFGLSAKRVESLKKSGVDIRFFNNRKYKIIKIFRYFFARTHRKVLVIDNKIGFVGGVNIQKEMKSWWDIHIKIHGHVVYTLLRAFAKSYIMSGGKRQDVRDLLRKSYRSRKNDVDIIIDEANYKMGKAGKKYSEALNRARERVVLFSPYYFPDKNFIRALWQAKKRGVRIDLLIPFRTDVRIATYAAYSWFSLMKKIGVNVYLTKKMMHGKGVIVDDEWAMIGSSNIDKSSFYNNSEANVLIGNKRVVQKLSRTIDKWLKLSQKLEDSEWAKRNWFSKILHKLAIKIVGLSHPKG